MMYECAKLELVMVKEEKENRTAAASTLNTVGGWLLHLTAYIK